MKRDLRQSGFAKPILSSFFDKHRIKSSRGEGVALAVEYRFLDINLGLQEQVVLVASKRRRRLIIDTFAAPNPDFQIGVKSAAQYQP